MSALEGLPDNVTQIGSVTISVFMGPDGLGHAYGFEGLTAEAAVGYLTVTLDRMRNQLSSEWGDDIDSILPDLQCPECGTNVFEPEDEDEDDE